MRKLILFLLFALSFSLFAIDSSRLDFTAYNNQDFSTEGTLKISVKDLISNSYSNSISSFVTQLKNPTLNSEFDAFQILVKSNIGNKVSISVSVSDFENPRFPNDKLSVNLSVNKSECSVLSYIYTTYDWFSSYYARRIYTLRAILNGLNFSTYFTYVQGTGSKVNGNGKFDESSIVYDDTVYTYSDKGIVYQISNTAELYMTYNMTLDEDEYNNLPEGVEFTSNVVINIEVEAWRK